MIYVLLSTQEEVPLLMICVLLSTQVNVHRSVVGRDSHNPCVYDRLAGHPRKNTLRQGAVS